MKRILSVVLVSVLVAGCAVHTASDRQPAPSPSSVDGPGNVEVNGRSPMIRKMFIVAKGNSAAYESLQNSVGTEPDIAIIYDRRSPSRPRRQDERRAQPEVDEEIGVRGFAVVRNEQAEPIQKVALATTRYNKLREIWRMPEVSPDN